MGLDETLLDDDQLIFFAESQKFIDLCSSATALKGLELVSWMRYVRSDMKAEERLLNTVGFRSERLWR